MDINLWNKCEDSIKEYEGLGNRNNDWIYHVDEIIGDKHIELDTFSKEIEDMFASIEDPLDSIEIENVYFKE